MRDLSSKSGLDRLGTAAKRAGAAVAAGMAAASVATAGFAVKAVRSASDLQQSMGAVDAIFKGNADQVHAWAKGASSDVGLARNEYSELASILGAQLKNGGTALDELGGKTNELIGVGADLAAQFGGSSREAVEALSSALKGERDPIERYGVSLNQAKIDAEAAALGFEKVGGALSDEATQAATLSLIMKQTSDAHGAFARESNTLAGQTQRLKANFTNLAASAGTLLLPVLTDIVTWTNDRILPALSNLGTGLKGVYDVVANGNFTTALRDAFGWEEDSAIVAFLFDLREAAIDVAAVVRDDVMPALQQFGSWLTEHKDQIAAVVASLASAGLVLASFAAGFQAVLKVQAAIAALQAFKAAVIALNAAMLANPVGLVIAGIAALAAALTIFFTQTETGAALWEQIWPRIQAAAQVVSDWFVSTVVPMLQTAWQAIQAAAQAFADWFTSTAVPALQVAWEAIQTAAGAAADWFLTYVAPIFTASGELIVAVVQRLSQVWSAVWGTVQAVWGSIGAPVLAAVGATVTVLQGVWAAAWANIQTVLSAAWTIIRTVVQTALQVIAGVIRAVTAAIRGDWSAVWNEIRGIASTVWAAIKTVISTSIRAVWTIITSTLRTIAAAFAAAWTGIRVQVTIALAQIVTTIRTRIATAARVVGELPGKARAALGNLGSTLSNAGRQLIQGFIDSIRAKFGEVKAELGRLTNLIPSWKGPASKDKTLLRGAGNLIIDGFVTGLEERYGAVRRSLQGLSQDVASTSFEQLDTPSAATAGRPGTSGRRDGSTGSGSLADLLTAGLRITSGRLHIDSEGFAHLIDGRIELDHEEQRRYAGMVGVGASRRGY